MNHRLASIALALTLAMAGCTFGPPAPTPTPTTPPPLATAQAVVTAARLSTTTPTPRPVAVMHGVSPDDPAPAESGLPLKEGYVIFAKIREDDAAAHVRELNPANPPAGAGKRYISVTVITSSAQQATKTLTIDSAEFGMICSSGAKFKPLTSLGAKGPDGRIDGGGQLLGELIFEVAKDEKAHLLTYAPSDEPGTLYYLKLISP